MSTDGTSTHVNLADLKAHLSGQCTCSSNSVCDGCKARIFPVQRQFLPLSKTDLPPLLGQNKAALKLCTETRGPKHPLILAFALRVAYWSAKSGDYGAAIRFYLPTLAVYAEQQHLREASYEASLGRHGDFIAPHLFAKEDFKTCLRVSQWTLMFFTERLGPLHEKTTTIEYMVASCMRILGDYGGADAVYRSAFAHEREAGDEARVAKVCCEMHPARGLVDVAAYHVSAGRLQRAAELLQMSLPLAKRACEKCIGESVVEATALALAYTLDALDDRPGAEEAWKRLISVTTSKRRLAAAHGSLARLYLRAGRPAEAAAQARRAWAAAVAGAGPTSHKVEEEAAFLQLIVKEWVRVNKKAPEMTGDKPPSMRELKKEIHELKEAIPFMRLRWQPPAPAQLQRPVDVGQAPAGSGKEGEKTSAPPDPDAADREAAKKLMKKSQWGRARALLDALLERSPLDFLARLQRIQCMIGAGQLEMADKEAEAAERDLAGVSASSSSDLANRVRELRGKVTGELRRREESARRREEEEQQRREQQGRLQQSEEGRRQQEAEARREREREEEEERRRQAELARWQEEEERRRAAERRRKEEERRAELEAEQRRLEQAREQERRLEEERRREEDQRRERERRAELERRQEERRLERERQAQAQRRRVEAQRRKEAAARAVAEAQRRWEAAEAELQRAAAAEQRRQREAEDAAKRAAAEATERAKVAAAAEAETGRLQAEAACAIGPAARRLIADQGGPGLGEQPCAAIAGWQVGSGWDSYPPVDVDAGGVPSAPAPAPMVEHWPQLGPAGGVAEAAAALRAEPAPGQATGPWAALESEGAAPSPAHAPPARPTRPYCPPGVRLASSFRPQGDAHG
eukprot:tig00020538_g10330.t1